MSISLELIKKIREQSGAGINDVKEALEASGGDVEKTLEILRKKGQKIAQARAGRTTSQGVIEAYVHTNGKVGVLVAVACETDFVARNRDFKDFAHEVALQVAAANPLYLSPEDVPVDVLNQEKEIYCEQLKNEGKPEAMLDKIITAKLEKFYAEVCLLKQPYIKDDKLTIEQLLEQIIAKTGEKIRIVNFIRFSL